ncbi:cystatin C (amyloid angiopathy and cerebral hemorrhage) [Echeneis naucrates]|uniref:cystatin C (amyloid angiopathy and cerebral hemorrhage) n=1 Tax=Echeneis naucrates TaxID=173247 RepID=UPI001113DA4D|nr:cystatin-like [Echeneis naucrates]
MWKLPVLPVFAALLAVGLAGLVGAPQSVDVNEPAVQEALKFAVVQHNKGTNDLYLSDVAQVISAQRQVVAGSKYTFTVRMGKTPCRKGATDQECSVHQDQALARPYTCKFVVWSRPWMNEISVLEEKC